MNLCVYIELLYRQEETDNRAVFKAQLTQRCTGKSRPRTSSAESKMGFRRRLVPHTYAMQRADTSTPKYPLHHMKTKKQRVMLARSTAKNLEKFPIRSGIRHPTSPAAGANHAPNRRTRSRSIGCAPARCLTTPCAPSRGPIGSCTE